MTRDEMHKEKQVRLKASNMNLGILIVKNSSFNPVFKSRHSCVDTGLAWSCTSNPPGHDTRHSEFVTNLLHNRTPGITWKTRERNLIWYLISYSYRETEREWKTSDAGHNIVADGWAGASNPHQHPNPPPTLKHTQKESKTLVFPLFNSISDWPTDGWTKPLI